MEPWAPHSKLDRIELDRHDPQRVEELWTHPDAVMLGVGGRSALLAEQNGHALRLLPCRGRRDIDRHFLLGTVEGRPFFVVDIRHLDADPDSGLGTTASLRSIAPHLNQTELVLATTAVALVNWHRVAPYCGRCGTVTQVRSAGHVRYCHNCDRERFPRTDPAIIVAILDADGRLLLGHHSGWERTRVSLLAGFVEAGESLEQAVHREVWEEAGLKLTSVQYLCSQPWPFPRSLMLGFVAEAEGTDINVDGTEIEWAHFYTRDEVEQKLATGELTLPMTGSIAARIVRQWRRGELSL